MPTPSVVTFDASPARAWLLALLSLGMTALSLAIAVPLLPNVAPGSLAQLAGWVGVLFFGAATVLIARQALTLRGPVVVLSPAGIRDARVSARPVPWPAVEAIGTWASGGQRVLVLKIPPGAWEASGPTRLARLAQPANRRLGADGYCITAQGLRAGYDALHDAVAAYLAAGPAR